MIAPLSADQVSALADRWPVHRTLAFTSQGDGALDIRDELRAIAPAQVSQLVLRAGEIENLVRSTKRRLGDPTVDPVARELTGVHGVVVCWMVLAGAQELWDRYSPDDQSQARAFGAQMGAPATDEDAVRAIANGVLSGVTALLEERLAPTQPRELLPFVVPTGTFQAAYDIVMQMFRKDPSPFKAPWKKKPRRWF